MKFEIIKNGTFAALKIALNAGEGIKAESGAMICKDSSIKIDAKMEGGLFGGIGRMLAGETFFLQTLSAGNEAGTLILAPTIIGEIHELELNGEEVWNLAKDGFFAGESGLSISTKMQNLAKGLFSGEGFFVLKISGKGKLFISSFGGIVPVDIEDGKDYIVDNHHLVAWPENAVFKIEKASSAWLNTLKSGEGLVTRFKGPTKVYVQTRSPKAFGSWLQSFISLKK